MNIRRSLSLFQFHSSFSEEDLTKRYKELVKKYHPDRNQDISKWCHSRMTEIQDAYSNLQEWLKENSYSWDEEDENENSHKPTETYERSYEEVNSDKRFTEGFSKAVRVMQSALFTYYQYGLNNRKIRKEGSLRYQFHSIERYFDKSLELLHEIARFKKNELDNHRYIVFYKGVDIIIEDIYDERLRPIRFQNDHEKQAYRLFEKSAQLIDNGIKEILFPDLLESRERGKSYHNVSAAAQNLTYLLNSYQRSTWGDRILSKLTLLDSFLDIIDLRDEGLINL